MSFTSCFLKWLTVTSNFLDVIIHLKFYQCNFLDAIIHLSSICIILIEGLMVCIDVSGTEQVVTQGCFELA
jgi:hypothetical protein